MEVYNGISSR